MDASDLESKILWLRDNSPYERHADLIEVGSKRRVYLMLHLPTNYHVNGDFNVFARRSQFSSASHIKASEIENIKCDGYVTTDQFNELQHHINSNIQLCSINTYDSVNNSINTMLRSMYENQVTLEGQHKLVFDRLYFGSKYFSEFFIINSKPSWWRD